MHGIGEDAVLADINALVERLKGEGLIRAREGEPRDEPPPIESAAGPYLEPAFEKFSDMQEMLLLDPIHEVSAEGWPHQKQEK